MLFAENLKRLRERCRFSKTDMAKKLDITPSAYGAYELKRREPSFEMLCKIADVLSTTTDELLGHAAGQFERYAQYARVHGFVIKGDQYDEFLQICPNGKSIDYLRQIGGIKTDKNRISISRQCFFQWISACLFPTEKDAWLPVQYEAQRQALTLALSTLARGWGEERGIYFLKDEERSIHP